MRCLKVRPLSGLPLPLLAISLLMSLVLDPAQAQQASMSVATDTRTTVFNQSLTPTPQSLDRAGSVSSNAYLQGDSVGFVGSAGSTAWGRVGYGYMQLQAFGHAELSGSGPFAEVTTNARASATLTDSFLIACPTCVAGTEATVTFRVVADWGVFADGSRVQQPDSNGSVFTAYSAVSSSFAMAAPSAGDPSQPAGTSMFRSVLRFNEGGEEHDRPIWGESVSARFTLGDPLSFTWQSVLDGAATAGNYTDLGATTAQSIFNTDASHTFYWGGISEVRDANGQLLTGITALNAVGVDYARALPPPPVPEPPAVILALLGASLLALVVRGRGSPAVTQRS